MTNDALTRALQAVGDKWTLLLVREMLHGEARTYQTLLTGAPGIPTNILAARLKRLVEVRLVEKRAYQDRPKRFTYSLTTAGKGLLPVVEALETWGIEDLGGRGGGLKPALQPAPPVEPAAPPKRNEWSFGREDSIW